MFGLNNYRNQYNNTFQANEKRIDEENHNQRTMKSYFVALIAMDLICLISVFINQKSHLFTSTWGTMCAIYFGLQLIVGIIYFILRYRKKKGE